MSSSELSAVVIGAGNAGRGQIAALEYCEVDVVAVASRSEASARRVARDHGIPHYSTDWRACLDEHRPDIVAIATPGDLQAEIVATALELGAHVFCERPLGLGRDAANRLADLAERHGRKTCFCAPALFQPQVLFARELIAEGAIGRLREIECVSNFNWPRFAPHTWQHDLAQGGGRLNHLFPNTLAAIHAIVDRPIRAAVGECRNDWIRVPAFDPTIDWADFYQRDPSDDELARFRWVDVDADSSYTASVQFAPPDESDGESVTALFRHSALNSAWFSDFTAFYGDRGTIHIQGGMFQGAVLLWSGGPTWEERAVPLEIVDALPLESNNDRRNWMTLMAQFLADIRGEEDFAEYPTFSDAAVYHSVMNAVRNGSSWRA
jgi:predicted dehydrogenase